MPHEPASARRPPAPRARIRRGFTLIELLTVIAILGVLMAILFPAISSVRASANNTKCQSNLRQIWLATSLYVGDNRTYPYSTSYTPDNGATNGINWRQSLRPYMGAGQPANNNEYNSPDVVCPSRTIMPTTNTSNVYLSSYSANPGIIVAPAPVPPSTQPAYSHAILPATVTRPAQIILYGDATQQTSGSSNSQFYSVPEMESAQLSANANVPISVANDSDPQTGGYIRYRHNGSMNAVMVDGHIRNFKKGSILNCNASASY